MILDFSAAFKFEFFYETIEILTRKLQQPSNNIRKYLYYLYNHIDSYKMAKVFSNIRHVHCSPHLPKIINKLQRN